MKTTTQTKLAFVAVFTFLLSLLPQVTKAQVNSPYSIQNNTGCTVQITWDFFTLDASGNCVYCASGGPVKIPSGGTFNLIDADFGSCWPACDLNINVIRIGGSTAGLPVTANSGSPNPGLPSIPGCTGPGANMNWGLFGCTINP